MHAIRYRRLFINLSMAPFYTIIRIYEPKSFQVQPNIGAHLVIPKRKYDLFHIIGAYVLDKFHILILIQLWTQCNCSDGDTDIVVPS